MKKNFEKVWIGLKPIEFLIFFIEYAQRVSRTNLLNLLAWLGGPRSALIPNRIPSATILRIRGLAAIVVHVRKRP